MTQIGPLPELDESNTFFWTSGADGRLRFLRCRDCRHFVHPPRPRCAKCYGEALEPEPVSGVATLATFSVNHQPWLPNMEVPFAVAIVEFPEQEGLRLMTNVVDCPLDDLHVGMALEVAFQEHGGMWVPLFRPAPGP